MIGSMDENINSSNFKPSVKYKIYGEFGCASANDASMIRNLLISFLTNPGILDYNVEKISSNILPNSYQSKYRSKISKNPNFSNFPHYSNVQIQFVVHLKKLELSPSCFKHGCICGHSFEFRNSIQSPNQYGITISPKVNPLNIKLRIEPID